MRKHLRAILPIALLGLVGAGNLSYPSKCFGFEWLWGSLAAAGTYPLLGYASRYTWKPSSELFSGSWRIFPSASLIYLFGGLFLIYDGAGLSIVFYR